MVTLPPSTTRTARTLYLSGFRPEFNDLVTHIPVFDTLRVTAENLQEMLTKGSLKSTQIVEEYHRSICKYNGYLNAVFELTPSAMKRAQELDDLRSFGTVLGPLHGIPVLLKDNMNTEPGMGLHTTGGALALVESKPSKHAAIVDSLLQAGMIILGKTTMSEFAFFKGTGIRCGWSAVHGQSQSAYVRGGLDLSDSIVGHSSPSGSSSGSCIAVSAGMSPVALGSETFGSLVNPATRASLYTIKPTRGIVPGHGILPIHNEFDTAGPLAKNPKDLCDLLDVLVDTSKTSVPPGGYASVLGGSWANLKVGTLDPTIWNSPPHIIRPVQEATEQIVLETNEAYAKIKTLAKTFHSNISSATDDGFMLDGDFAIQSRLLFGFQDCLNRYLSDLASSKIRSLQELVDWNYEHFEEALTSEYPNQDILVAGLENERDPQKLKRIQSHLQVVGDGFLNLFDKYDIDVIISPGDGGVYNFSAACGSPIATLPLSYLNFNGRPFGLTIAARPHQESMLIKAMSAWYDTFTPRQPPTAFLEELHKLA